MTSRGIGRSRSRIAAAMTSAMRTSPFTVAVASDSVPRTLNRGFSAVGVASVTSSSPRDGSTSSM